MWNRAAAGIRKWLFPADAVFRMITMDGDSLTVETGTSRKPSLSRHRLKVPVPGRYNYGVEYKVSEQGEFRVGRGEHGGMVVRSEYARSCTIPVCWMPDRFLGKTVDRYITHIDGRKVHYKASHSDRPSLRPGGRYFLPASYP